MSSITGPKARLCRKYGGNLFGSPKYDKILAKKPHGPGIHGMKRKSKLSQYGEQLRAKQIARIMFAISESQFGRYIKKAITKQGDTELNIIQFLETRADNVIYKSGLAATIFQARQMVSHGHFELNGQKINTPSIQLKVGDVLKVRDNKKKLAFYGTVAAAKDDKTKVAAWLKTNRKDLQVDVIALPEKEHFDQVIQLNLIVEFYSR